MDYNYDYCLEKSLEYFNGDSLAAKVFLSKYALKDKNSKLLESSPDEMHDRLATEIFRIEQNYKNPMAYEDIRELLHKFKFIIPQGGPMSGIGNTHQNMSLSNCFVINDHESDSYGGIMRTDEEQVQIMKRRGGVGHDLSHIRPKGSKVLNSALTSTGVDSFMDRYSNSTKEVAQDGRRGALMLTIDVRHPDVEHFINAKLEEGRIEGANISVKLTDDFMRAVVEDGMYVQQFPINSHKPQIKNSVRAREIWKLIIRNAWKSAEPGVLFWDNMLKESVSDCYGDEGFKTVSTNPCFTGDTIVATADGRNGVTIRELAEINAKFPVYSAKNRMNYRTKWKTEIKSAIAFKTGDRNVIEVTLSDGSVFKCTPEHLLATQDGKYVEAKDSINLELAKFYSYSSKNSNKNYRMINSKSDGYSRQYRLIWEYLHGKYDGKTHNVNHIDHIASNDLIENLELVTIEEHKAKTKRCGTDNPVYRTDPRKVQLINKIRNIRGNANLWNWSVEKRNEALEEFYSEFGEELESLQNQPDLNIYLDEKVFVTEIKELGIEPVYDLTVEDNHNFYILTKWDDDKFLNSSGVLVHNCAELPLSPYDSCRLLAINLFNYVENPFTPQAKFNFELLKDHAKKSTRIMDDIIELEIESVDSIIGKINSDPESKDIRNTELNMWRKIRANAERGRRAGIGITAEGDAIAALGINYGSEDSIDIVDEIHKTLALSVYRESINLAKERGQFQVFDFEKEKNNPFLNRLYDSDPELRDLTIRYGRRNIALLTIAPTGTTSLMSQTTSGIEPLFKPFYKRRRKIRSESTKDTWEEYLVFHHNFINWHAIKHGNSIDQSLKILEELASSELDEIIKDSPYNNATAKTIDWQKRVEVQATAQKWIDHSISSTVNLPKNVSVDAVNDIYLNAWKLGCKGMTVYRDGSRDGILIDANEINDLGHPKKRPMEIECDIIHFINEGDQWIAIIGLIGNKPYEIFTGKYDLSIVPKHVTHGSVLKRKVNSHSEYILKYVNGHGPAEMVISECFDKQFWNYAKLLSGVMRNNMPIIDVVNLVSGLHLSDHINTWKNGVKRALKKYIPNGTESKGSECENCGESGVIYQEGCEVCMNCGSSKCG